MTICAACGKNVKKTIRLTLIESGNLCEDCFEYIIEDDSTREVYIDSDI